MKTTLMIQAGPENLATVNVEVGIAYRSQKMEITDWPFDDGTIYLMKVAVNVGFSLHDETITQVSVVEASLT